MSSRADYGIDSPGMVASFFVLCLICAGSAVAFFYSSGPHPVIVIALIVAGIYFFLSGSGMLLYSKAGKLRIRDEILRSLRWNGDERILDVGCGRGLLLIGAAKRLTTGEAVGVDLWQKGALSGNAGEAVVENARIEGVEDRVQVKEGDVRDLPFEDAWFDIVVSNFVVHEVSTAAEREQMLGEMVRVLRPGGQIALVDFIFTGECARLLGEKGIQEVTRLRVGSLFNFWLGAILNFGLVQTYKVYGIKPLAVLERET